MSETKKCSWNNRSSNTGDGCCLLHFTLIERFNQVDLSKNNSFKLSPQKLTNQYVYNIIKLMMFTTPFESIMFWSVLYCKCLECRFKLIITNIILQHKACHLPAPSLCLVTVGVHLHPILYPYMHIAAHSTCTNAHTHSQNIYCQEYWLHPMAGSEAENTVTKQI